MRKLLLLTFVITSAFLPANAQNSATIDIDTTNTLPVHANFSGLNDEVSTPIEYQDYRFNTLARGLNLGWVRFPGGISSDAYDWQTGEEHPSWVTQFTAGSTEAILLRQMQTSLAGKGGGKFIDAANRANFLNAKLVIAVNAFTETPESIGKMAAYAKANGIPVAVWELSNEAYLLTEFYKNGADYLTKMKPFRDAIKAADPTAMVAIFANDSRANPNNAWDAAIGSFPDKYWDAVTYHFYPAQSSGDFNQWMADENAGLITKTDAYITNHLAPINPPGTFFLISEFNPSLGNAGGTSPTNSLTNGTLYGAIYVAEFTMRMSRVLSMLCVGAHAIFTFSGVDNTEAHYAEVDAAARAGKTVNTANLDFGYFYGAQAGGVAIVNGVVNSAVKSNKTTVTGGATVPATGLGQIPALYAMAYTNAVGALSVVVTNKSAHAQQITIRVNGSAAAGPFPIQYISGTDPSVMNTPANKNAVTIQTGTAGNPVTAAPYSVVRVDISTPAVATFVSAASYRAGPLAPEQLVSAFGTGFASQTLSASQQPLPAILGDTSIVITDSAGTTAMAPLVYVSPGQANFQIPAGLAAGNASVKVIRAGSTVLTGSMTLTSSAPAIFSANGNGAGVITGSVSRVNDSGTTALPLYSCQNGVALSCISTPISLGSAGDKVYVTMFGTGVRGAATVAAFVAGQPVMVSYAGTQGQFAGLDQVNILLPRSLAGTGEASVYLIADGTMSNVLSLNIQ